MIRNFIFGYIDQKSSTTNFALLILRLFTGLSMAIAHGFGKLPPSENFIESTGNLGFPFPFIFAWAAALSEFLGGIFITLGLFTRPASFFLGITMLTAAFLSHGGDPFSNKEKALLYLCISVFLLLTGAGKYSVDASFEDKKPKYYV